MTHANPEFSIIIVTHNSNYYLVECMKALTTQRNKNFEIIIVDNNSNEDLINFDKFNSLEIKIIKSAFLRVYKIKNFCKKIFNLNKEKG